MPVNVPFPGLVDLRQPVLGDSYNWYGLEPVAAKKSLVVHHSASPNNQDGFDIAAHHVNGNKWGGVGYHLVITHDSYAGRPPFTSPGAQVQYVGDLATYRAHVANANPGRVGICLIGNFVNGVPGKRQLELLRQLIDFFIAPNNILPSINYYSQVMGHGLIAGQSTACPGYANPNFNAWFNYAKGGEFPHHLYAAPAPAPAPIVEPAPTPVIDVIPPAAPETPVEASDLVPGKGGDIPEYEATYRPQRSQRPIAREGAHGVDITTGLTVVPSIEVGTVIDVAGYFDFQGHTYARTVYSETHGKWNGLDTVYFDLPTGQPSGAVEVTVNPATEITPNPVIVDEVQSNVTDEQFKEATVPDVHISIWQKIAELIASLTALIIKRRTK